MQRRAAAVYGAFFLVVGVAALSVTLLATPPELTFQNPTYELSNGQTVRIGGETYNVSITAEMQSGGGGGHGGGGGPELVRSGTLSTIDPSVRQTTTWQNGSTVTYRNESWTLTVVTNDTARLTAVIDRTAILRNDSTVRNQTQTIDGVTYVVRPTGADNVTLIPASEYFPEPAETLVVENETLPYDGRETTVAAIDNGSVTLAWTTAEPVEISVTDGANVTVGNATYYAHLPDNDTLILSQNFDRVHEFHESRDAFSTHKNGLWGVTLVSGAGLIFLVAFAFLPSRY